ncbi:MAG: hypothetical protein J7555_00590 [Chloroflexi bacterium]|nr:hypothetical protein [Chloroflexota bacterium]
MTARLVVLISGNGTNLQAILDACANGTLPAQVVAVFSNKADAYGLVRAQRAGVPALFFPKREGEPRARRGCRFWHGAGSGGNFLSAGRVAGSVRGTRP